MKITHEKDKVWYLSSNGMEPHKKKLVDLQGALDYLQEQRDPEFYAFNVKTRVFINYINGEWVHQKYNTTNGSDERAYEDEIIKLNR